MAAQTQKHVHGFDSYGNEIPVRTSVYDEGITLTNTFAEILAIDFRAFRYMLLTVHNTGTTSMQFQVWGSNKHGSAAPASSDDSWTQLPSDGTDYSVAAGKDGVSTLTERWIWVSVRAKYVTSGTNTAKAYARLLQS